MHNRFHSVSDAVRRALSAGVLYVLIGNTLVKFIMFFSSVFLPRFFSTKAEYGNLTLIDNTFSIIMLFNGLGLANSILRYVPLADSEQKKTLIFRHCLIRGMVFNAVILVCVLIVLPFLNYNDAPQAKQYIFLFALTPALSFLFDCIQLYMRGIQQNKYYSVISVTYALLSASQQILLTMLFGIPGTAAARYSAYIITIVLGFVLLKKIGVFKEKKLQPPKEDQNAYLKYGVTAMSGNFASLLMPLLSAPIIMSILGDTIQLANYKTASMIPQNLDFIAQSAMIFVFPYFARNYEDGRWLKKHYFMLTGVLAAAMAVLVVLLVLFAQPVIGLFYGNKYLDVAWLMNICYVVFGAGSIIRTVIGNVLAAIGEVRFNLYMNIGTLVVCIALNYILVPPLGVLGVPLALFLVYFIAGVISIAYFLRLCKKREAVG